MRPFAARPVRLLYSRHDRRSTRIWESTRLNDQPRNIPAPCIINEGTLVNKRDMLRVLETLDGVDYVHSVEGEIISAGQALVSQVFAGRTTATLLANNCLFINVNSFDYLRFWQEDGRTLLELHQGTSVLRLTPLPEEESESSAPLNRQIYAEPQFDEETFALLEEDDEEF